MGRPALLMDNKIFGRLTVIGRSNSYGKNGEVLWECVCKCGKSKSIDGALLRKGAVRSCGCLRLEIHTTHGKANSRTYRIWKGMRARCNGKNLPSYRFYGGRGISVCARWNEFSNFLLDMGEVPTGMSLDRINNDGNYEPGNCRWATHEIQANNRRDNRGLILNGLKSNIGQWANKIGIDRHTIARRLKRGVDLERTLTRQRTNARILTYNGQSKTLTQWANETGLNKYCLWERLRNNWELSLAIETPIRFKRRNICQQVKE